MQRGVGDVRPRRIHVMQEGEPLAQYSSAVGPRERVHAGLSDPIEQNGAHHVRIRLAQRALGQHDRAEALPLARDYGALASIPGDLLLERDLVREVALELHEVDTRREKDSTLGPPAIELGDDDV